MKLFKTYSEKEVKRVMPIVNKINSLEEEMTKLTDKELREKTDYFKKQLEEGKTLDEIISDKIKEQGKDKGSAHIVRDLRKQISAKIEENEKE